MFAVSKVMRRRAGIGTISYHGSAYTSSGSNFPLPASCSAGQLAVFGDFAAGSSTPTTALPTGATSIVNTTDSANLRSILSYRILTSGDVGTGSLSGGMTGSLASYRMVAVFTVPNLASVTPGGGAGNISSIAAASSVSVTASGGTGPMVVVGFYASYLLPGETRASVLTPAAFTYTTNTADEAAFGWEIVQSGSGTNRTLNSTVGLYVMQGCYLQFS